MSASTSIDVDGFLSELDEWAAVNPVKTYAQDFFKKFPNAKSLIGTKVPFGCTMQHYGGQCPYGRQGFGALVCHNDYCGEHLACWNRPPAGGNQMKGSEPTKPVPFAGIIGLHPTEDAVWVVNKATGKLSVGCRHDVMYAYQPDSVLYFRSKPTRADIDEARKAEPK